jgi:hypothetical protein
VAGTGAATALSAAGSVAGTGAATALSAAGSVAGTGAATALGAAGSVAGTGAATALGAAGSGVAATAANFLSQAYNNIANSYGVKKAHEVMNVVNDNIIQPVNNVAPILIGTGENAALIYSAANNAATAIDQGNFLGAVQAFNTGKYGYNGILNGIKQYNVMPSMREIAENNLIQAKQQVERNKILETKRTQDILTHQCYSIKRDKLFKQHETGKRPPYTKEEHEILNKCKLNNSLEELQKNMLGDQANKPSLTAQGAPQYPYQPGMHQPGMHQPGMHQPGMHQPGMHQPGMHQPGIPFFG